MDVINLNFFTLDVIVGEEGEENKKEKDRRQIKTRAFVPHYFFLPHAEMIMAYGDGVVGKERAQQATKNIAIISQGYGGVEISCDNMAQFKTEKVLILSSRCSSVN